MGYQSDLEIAQRCTMQPICDIARTVGIDDADIEPYGRYKAKVALSVLGQPPRGKGKLVLVTAITPTPAGEGKTTTTVGLTDALVHIGRKAMLCLREPSLGPSFGQKGGAAGDGCCRFCCWWRWAAWLHHNGARTNILRRHSTCCHFVLGSCWPAVL